MGSGAETSRMARDAVVDPLRRSPAVKRRLLIAIQASLAVGWTGLAISDGRATHIVLGVVWSMLTVWRVLSEWSASERA